ncbi:hypothetical protein D3C87_751230 [compost metagenome]
MDLIRGQLIERYLDIQPLSLALHLEVVHPLLLDGQRVDRQRPYGAGHVQQELIGLIR